MGDALIPLEQLPATSGILPLHNALLFPGGVLPVRVSSQSGIELLKHAVREDAFLVLVAEHGADGLARFGTLSKVTKLFKYPDGSYAAEIQGLAAVQIGEVTKREPFVEAVISGIERGDDETTPDVKALETRLRAQIHTLLEAMKAPPEQRQLIDSIQRPGHLADLVMANVPASLARKEECLAATTAAWRLTLALAAVSEAISRLAQGARLDAFPHAETPRPSPPQPAPPKPTSLPAQTLRQMSLWLGAFLAVVALEEGVVLRQEIKRLEVKLADRKHLVEQRKDFHDNYDADIELWKQHNAELCPQLEAVVPKLQLESGATAALQPGSDELVVAVPGPALTNWRPIRQLYEAAPGLMIRHLEVSPEGWKLTATTRCPTLKHLPRPERPESVQALVPIEIDPWVPLRRQAESLAKESNELEPVIDEMAMLALRSEAIPDLIDEARDADRIRSGGIAVLILWDALAPILATGRVEGEPHAIVIDAELAPGRTFDDVRQALGKRFESQVIEASATHVRIQVQRRPMDL
ncbi:MAG: LON peptidase substrate-binding domain-containing protein [Deltaproteobacteria bacterium]|nr:LON peptidase substrate-binding domain-containing protein [Deltaproteobacteria bacterium]